MARGLGERVTAVGEILQPPWVKPLLAIWVTIGAWDLLGSQFIPEPYSKNLAKVYQVIGLTGHLPLGIWAALGAAIAIIATIEYVVRHRRRSLEKKSHSKPVTASSKYPAIIASLVTIILLLGTSYYRASSVLPPASQKSLPSWIVVALNETGVSMAGPDAKQHLPKIMGYMNTVSHPPITFDEDGIITSDWSSAFVEWSLNQVGIQGPKSSNPLHWDHWKRLVWERANLEADPELGCVMVFSLGGDRKHVAFFLTSSKDYFVVLGGNQNKGVGVKPYSRRQALSCHMPS
jgi:uncharacterized protein (TIGR02594 family)